MDLFNLPFFRSYEAQLGWLISRVKNVETSEANAKASEEAASNSAEESQTAAGSAFAYKEQAKGYKDDARQSADGAAATANDLTNLSNQVQVNTSRIDNLVANAGDTDNNAELLSIRVGQNGNTYATAGNGVRSIAQEFNAFTKYIAGKHMNPIMELGDIYVSNGNAAFYNSTTRIRSKNGEYFNLSAGDIVGVFDDAVQYTLIKYANGSYNYVFSGFTTADTTITDSGQYYILMQFVGAGTISNLADVASQLYIRTNSQLDALIANYSINQHLEDRLEKIDPVRMSDHFENGDLYVNSSGIGTYYNSNTRVRSIHDQPFTFKVGTIIHLIGDYNVWRLLVRKKDPDTGLYSNLAGGWWHNDIMIEEAGLYEILISKDPESAITAAEVVDMVRIIEPDTIDSEQTNIVNMTDVFDDELKTSIDAALVAAEDKGLMFGIITDTHVDAKRGGYYAQTMENLERLDKALRFNGIVHLGDIVNGYTSAPVTKNVLNWAIRRLLYIAPGRTFVTVGNHDNNNGAGDSERLADNVLYSYTQRFNEGYVYRNLDNIGSVYDTQTSNYYVDYPSMNIRIIYFDSTYYSGGFSDQTINWVRQAMQSAPASYRFVFFTHESTEAALNGGVALGNASRMKSLLAEYEPQILCYIHGHSHQDCVDYTNVFPMIGLCATVPDMPPGTVVGTVPSRTPGTVTQDCISVIQICTDANEVRLVRFGAGNDQVIPFRQ